MLGELIGSRITFYHMLLWGVAAGVVSIALTVAVDSVMYVAQFSIMDSVV
jgi:hypothetical protein